MKQHSSPRTPRRQRRTAGRTQDPHVDDPYKAQQKPLDPSVCTGCGAVFHGGHWCWMARPTDAKPVICQACHRIKDSFPAGEVTLKGAFIEKHKKELLAAARHNEEMENKEHPMNRIMNVEDGKDKIVITTTDIHLPRRIGEALHRAYHGKLDFHYDEDSYFVRVLWTRDE